MLELNVQRDEALAEVPEDGQFLLWAMAAVGNNADICSLDISIISADESRRLNKRYRGKDRPTNVLSFPSRFPEELAGQIGYLPLGDLAICAPVVAAEAAQQEKPVMHHWAHMTVHGVLHLLGHDHQDDEAAQGMEMLERDILDGFDIPDPYRES